MQATEVRSCICTEAAKGRGGSTRQVSFPFCFQGYSVLILEKICIIRHFSVMQTFWMKARTRKFVFVQVCACLIERATWSTHALATGRSIQLNLDSFSREIRAAPWPGPKDMISQCGGSFCRFSHGTEILSCPMSCGRRNNARDTVPWQLFN